MLQMEKRTETLSSEASTQQRFRRSRAVLQQGLQLNPHSARICQVRQTLQNLSCWAFTLHHTPSIIRRAVARFDSLE